MTPTSSRSSRGARGTQAPSLDFDETRLTDLSDGTPDLLADGDLEGRAFSDVRLDSWDVGIGSTIEACGFTGLTVGAWTIRGARIIETTIAGADVPVVSAARCGLRDVVVRDSRFGSIESYDAVWRGIRFTRCKLGYVNLRAAELLDVAFVDCTIDELDLLDASARRVSFGPSRIGTLNVTGAGLAHVDLRGADIGEIVGMAGLRGATISPDQLQLMATALADLAGIVIED